MVSATKDPLKVALDEGEPAGGAAVKSNELTSLVPLMDGAAMELT